MLTTIDSVVNFIKRFVIIIKNHQSVILQWGQGDWPENESYEKI